MEYTGILLTILATLATFNYHAMTMAQNTVDTQIPTDSPQNENKNSDFLSELPAPVIVNTFGGPCKSNSESQADSSNNKVIDPSARLMTRVRSLTNRVSQLLGYIHLLLIRQESGGGSEGEEGECPGDRDDQRLTDCEDVRDNGTTRSGVYKIHPRGAPDPFDVFCDFRGSIVLTIIQSRANNSLDFQQSWSNYKSGFGTIEPYGNFWLGLDKIYYITQQAQYRLRVDMIDFNDFIRFAEYASFSIGPELDFYRLRVFLFDPQSTVDDSFSPYHNMHQFSTFDNDRDSDGSLNCALDHGGGWWYNDCDNSNLNGNYSLVPDLTGLLENGIEWDGWRQLYSLAGTSMGVRRNFKPNVNIKINRL